MRVTSGSASGIPDQAYASLAARYNKAGHSKCALKTKEVVRVDILDQTIKTYSSAISHIS